jgi:hypothetical protein
VFVRDGVRLSEAERRRRLLDAPFALAAPKAGTAYSVNTPAGEIAFDNPVARRMVSGLAKGPRRLGDLAGDGVSNAEILANAMILAGARLIWPVENGAAGSAQAFNRAVFDRLGGPDELMLLALDCGTALTIAEGPLWALKARAEVKGATAAWRRHFAVHGAAAA